MSSTRTTISLGLLAILAIAPTAYASKNDARNQASSQAQTQEYVDARMHETLSSIDRSLNKLLVISRGGEPQRKEGIIGPTVAGAAGPARPVATPSPAPVSPMDPSVLKRRVQIQWNGSAEDLLRSMSNQLGFAFSTQNLKGPQPKVRLEGQDMTVEQTLNLVAEQLQGRSDIVVSLPNRKIELVGR